MRARRGARARARAEERANAARDDDEFDSDDSDDSDNSDDSETQVRSLDFSRATVDVFTIEVFALLPAECLSDSRFGFYVELVATLLAPTLTMLYALLLSVVVAALRRARVDSANERHPSGGQVGRGRRSRGCRHPRQSGTGALSHRDQHLLTEQAATNNQERFSFLASVISCVNVFL